MKTIIEFDDQGQDFTSFSIRNGVVIESIPFQTGIWGGAVVLNKQLRVGDNLSIATRSRVLVLKYPIIAIQENQPMGDLIILEKLSSGGCGLVCTSVDDVKSGIAHQSDKELNEAAAYLAERDEQKTKLKLLKAEIIRRSKKGSARAEAP